MPILRLPIVRTINNPVIYLESKISSHIVSTTTKMLLTQPVEVGKAVGTSSKTKVRNNQIRTEWELANATTIDLDFA